MATQSYLIDEITRRSIFVIAVGNNRAEEARGELLDLTSRVVDILEGTPDDRVLDAVFQVEQAIRDGLNDVSADLLSDLSEFASAEAAWTASLLDIATSADQVAIPTVERLEQFTGRQMTLVSGRDTITNTPDELLRAQFTDSYADRARGIMLQGITEGRTVQQIVPELTDLTESMPRDVRSTALTMYNHYGNQTRNAVYEENEDILQGVRLVATLDSRTSPTCQFYDGKRYPVDSGPRPPFHYNCRTQAVPDVRDEFRIDIPGRTRASQFGPVDAQLTYDGFLRRQTEDFQNMVLGINRAKAFRAGLPVDRFTNDQGIRLTLDQLRQLYPERF